MFYAAGNPILQPMLNRFALLSMPMSYQPGSLDAALASSVGDDASLVMELRAVFIESADRQIDLMSRSRCDSNWQVAAWRLKGLAASFGLSGLMAMADEAADAAPGDPVILRRLRHIMDGYRTAE